MRVLHSKYSTAGCIRILPFLLLLSLVLGLSGCKTSRRMTSSTGEPRYLSSKVQLTIPNKGGTVTVNGTMKLVSGERMQLSFLMPILRSEIARLEITPNDVLVVDRMGKRYVQATRKELKDILPRKADFAYLEKILFDAAKPGGKATLTGKELGIPSLEKGKIVLTDFSNKEISLTPTQVSSRYTKVEWTELLDAGEVMRHFLCIFIGCFCLALPLCAQSNKMIKELESKRGALQKQIAESETLLNTTKKDVGSQLNGLAALTGQIEERKRYILTINNDMETIDRELSKLERQLVRLENDLKDKKKKYEDSVKYLYKNRSVQEKLLFILSAKTLSQTYRRMRYVREYADYQRLQGEEILKKQEQVNQKKTELQQVKKAKASLLKEREVEKEKLEAQEKEKRTLVANLQKKQRGLQNELNKKRKEANQLNARIDRLIAEEIEKARKRAAEEARKEAAARKKAAAKETKSAATSSSEKATTKKAAPLETYTMDKADRELSGSFVSNRGKLPMPITGPYIITSRYGQYSVEGLRNVKLDNKGIDIQGKPGAQARAIFNGKVAAVFQLNGLFNILIRHGNYISVYCNLSSASVKTGDTVTTRQVLGQVFSDGADNGRTVLHFQLRKEKEKLNPEPWLNR